MFLLIHRPTLIGSPIRRIAPSVTTMRRRVLMLPLAATMLAACSGTVQSQPTLLPPASDASPAPTTAAPSTPAATPSASRSSGSRDEQLVAAATEWYEAIKRSYATLDSSELEALSHPDCRGCQRQIALVRDAAEQKHRYELGEFRITKTRILGKPTADGGSVRVEWSFEGLEARSPSGSVIRRVERESSADQVDLVRQDGSLLVRRLLGLQESR